MEQGIKVPKKFTSQFNWESIGFPTPSLPIPSSKLNLPYPQERRPLHKPNHLAREDIISLWLLKDYSIILPLRIFTRLLKDNLIILPPIWNKCATKKGDAINFFFCIHHQYVYAYTIVDCKEFNKCVWELVDNSSISLTFENDIFF